MLALPGRPPRAVLAALDGPPLVIEDAQALLRDPPAEAARIVAGVPGLTPGAAPSPRRALRRAVEMADAP